MSVITRRGFLKATALAGAGAALEGCSFPRARAPFDVLILGAGMAGMAAARDLARAGLDVVLLEARDRPGGRMETHYDQSPHGLELGAQMIHGSRAPTWDLIHEFGIETRPLREWGRRQSTPSGRRRRSDPVIETDGSSRTTSKFSGGRVDTLDY